MVYGSKEFRKKKEKQKQAYLTLTERRAWLRGCWGPPAGRSADRRGADGRVNREGRRRGLQLEASTDDSSGLRCGVAPGSGLRLSACRLRRLGHSVPVDYFVSFALRVD